MMIKPKFIIVALVLLAIGVIGYFATKNDQLIPKTSFNPIPYSELPEAELKIPTGEKMKVGEVEVNNIYKSEVDPNNYGDVAFIDNPSYQTVYIFQGKYFLITILSTPFNTVRTEAERQFLTSLGITEAEACKLDVRITTPYWVNPDTSGETYRLSFCQ